MMRPTWFLALAVASFLDFALVILSWVFMPRWFFAAFLAYAIGKEILRVVRARELEGKLGVEESEKAVEERASRFTS